MAGDDDSSSTITKQRPKVELTRRTISPYDLTAGDNPGTIISRPSLRGPNYDEWSASIRLALKARKKFGFAYGTILKPGEDSEDWCANNALVVSWIKLTIDETLCATLSHSDDAFSLWTQIQRRFRVKNGQHVQRLKTELATCRQNGSPIETYYGKLTKWTSLNDYQQAKTQEEIAKEKEEDKLHQFLMGIDESLYGAVKSSLLSRTPLPSLDEAYNILIQDEESKSLACLHEETNNGVSFAVQTQSKPRQEARYVAPSTLTCTLCGRNGHLGEFCFKKFGYLEWWNGNRGKPDSGSQEVHIT